MQAAARKSAEDAAVVVKKLEKQKAELMNSFRQQVKLIENFKSQMVTLKFEGYFPLNSPYPLMDPKENNSSDVQKLLHPELLSQSELLDILASRCVRQEMLSGLDKNQLVDLFRRIVMPLPQRIYQNKRRGKMLNELRRQKEKSTGESDDLKSHDDKKTAQHRLSNTKGRPCEQESPNRSSKHSLDHIVINDRRKIAKTDKTADVKDAAAGIPEKNDCSRHNTSTIVKLNRRDTNSSEKSSSSTNEDEAEHEDKKKRRRIVWP
ncbi:hypothetical protein J437_LFUL017097 [Ladona fulva]|uniref:Ashwin n=1 Tax=Ladona fulva TaxID=123851 RepID=A0A8K0KG31_LADFU|nr:hypothetical protein J437_LFUL017097 [Ladona fulva]